MKNLIQKILLTIRSPKRVKVGTIIYWKDKKLESSYKIAHAVTPTETGQCEVEGCNEFHGP